MGWILGFYFFLLFRVTRGGGKSPFGGMRRVGKGGAVASLSISVSIGSHGSDVWL